MLQNAKRVTTFCLVQSSINVHTIHIAGEIIASVKKTCLTFLQLIWMRLHHRVEFSLEELIFILSLSLVYKLLLTFSVYPLWPAQYPAVTQLIATDKHHPMWYDLSKGQLHFRKVRHCITFSAFSRHSYQE